MTHFHAQRGENEREFADLGHRQAGQETGAPAIPHCPHDHHDDQRVADQDKRGQHSRGTQLGAESSQLETGAQFNEEEHQQEIAQTDQPRPDEFPER